MFAKFKNFISGFSFTSFMSCASRHEKNKVDDEVSNHPTSSLNEETFFDNLLILQKDGGLWPLNNAFANYLGINIVYIKSAMLLNIDVNIEPINDDYIATILAIVILDTLYNKPTHIVNKKRILDTANNAIKDLDKFAHITMKANAIKLINGMTT
jgi:hypothetical protein